jgi:hypothetical protein
MLACCESDPQTRWTCHPKDPGAEHQRHNDSHLKKNGDQMKETPYAWVVVWATFGCLALIFGVSYSFAAFFESFAAEF